MSPLRVLLSASLVGGMLLGVACESTTSPGNDLRVEVTTAGVSLDPDGYQIQIDQGSPHHVPVNGTLSVPGVLPGLHAIRVNDLSLNCSVSGGNPQLISVPPDAQPSVSIQLVCRLALSDALVFSSNRAGKTAIFAAAADGSNPIRLSDTTANSDGAAISPDGTRIAFASVSSCCQRDIFVMDVNGGNVLNLTNDPADDLSPAWSPDGRKLAFLSSRSGGFEAYVMNSDGSGVIRLTYTPYVFGPISWSPDGARLAINIRRPVDENQEIILVGADGSGSFNLSHSTANDYLGQWSPDGGHVLFTSDRDGNLEIYSGDVSSGVLQRLTTSPGEDVDPRWSPDGGRILFSSNRGGSFDLYVMNADGSGPVSITNTSDAESRPGWTPDGTRIVFVSFTSGNQDIWVVQPDGTQLTNLTHDPASDFSWTWAPAQ